jgi:predicted amidohydrolase
MHLSLAQFIVTDEIERNRDKILAVLDSAKPAEWVIFPEGMLSGYTPADPDYLNHLDPDAIRQALETIQACVQARGCYCLFGAALPQDDNWYNATVFIDQDGWRQAYRKINLATLDRAHFAAGDELPVFQADGATFGVQMCRELLFPEQWRLLKQDGAQIIFHINNALKPQDAIWRHLLITRALENQCFVISVNNGASPQLLPSLVISPQGVILRASQPDCQIIMSIHVDLAEASDEYLQQARTDVVRVVGGEGE